MVRNSVFEIVTEDKIYADFELKEIKMNELYIRNVFTEVYEANRVMARCNLIKRLQICLKCVGEKRLRYVKRNSAFDGYIYMGLQKTVYCL